MVIGIPLEVIA